jgi:ABC-type lipoprotein release transport system permease subunit
MLKVKRIARLIFVGVRHAALGALIGVIIGVCGLWAVNQLPKTSQDSRLTDIACMSTTLDKLAAILPPITIVTSDPRLTYELNAQHQQMLIYEANKICNL